MFLWFSQFVAETIMPFMLECPSGHRLKVPSKMAGLTIVCPVCESRVAVPPSTAQKTNTATVTQENLTEEAPPIPAPAVPPPHVTSSVPAPTTKEQVQRDQALVTDHASPPKPKRTSHNEIPRRTDNAVPKISALREFTEVDTAPLPNLSELRSDVADEPAGNESAQSNEVLANHAFTDQAPGNASFNESRVDPPHSTEPVAADVPFTPEQLQLLDDVAEPTANPTWIVIDTDSKDSITTRGTPKGIKPIRRHSGVFWLAAAAILVSIVSSGPPILQHITSRQIDGTPDSWTYVVLLGALIQVGVAVLALCIPDWSTQWIGAIATTGFAAFYALGLALTMFASQDHQLVRELGLLDEAFRNQAQPWCFFIMCLTLILAFCYGRYSMRWYYAERQLRGSLG